MVASAAASASRSERRPSQPVTATARAASAGRERQRPCKAYIVPGSLRVTVGEELLRAFEPVDGFAKVFCSVCGSQLWSRNPENLSALSVRMGAFDSDPGVRPSVRQFVAYAAEWEPIPDDGLPRYPERRSPDA